MKPGKITKDVLASLKDLTDEQRAELSARLDEIAELETAVDTIKKEKADADQIIARAGEVEKASQAKDAKILELEGLVTQFTQKKISHGLLSGFFGEDF